MMVNRRRWARTIRFGGPILVWASVLSIGFGAVARAEPVGPAGLSPHESVPLDDPSQIPEPSAFRCWPELQHTITPSILLLGETPEVTVTLAIKPICYGGGYPEHVLVILTGVDDDDDRSNMILLERLSELVDQLQIGELTSSRMGIVVVNGDRARTVLPITSDRDAILAALGNWHRSRKGTRTGIAEAFRQAREAFDSAFDALPPHDLPEPREFTIVVGDLGGSERCDRLAREAGSLQNTGVLTITACATADCRTRCHRDVATNEKYAFGEHDWEEFASFYGAVTGGFRFILPRRLDVELDLSPHFEFMDRSASPPVTLREGKRLLWSFENTYVPLSGVTYTYRVRPISELTGDHAIAEPIFISMWSNHNYPNYVTHRSFLSPRLLVLRPRAWPIRTERQGPTADVQ